MANRGERPSWRGDATGVGGNSDSGVAKWILVLVSVGLVAALIALLILPIFRVKTHFVAITTGEVARLGLPPIPFAQEDLAALDRSQQLEVHHFREVNESAKLNSLAAELDSYEIRPGHVLMVYISAQTAVFDGVAYLLDENFSAGAQKTERDAAFRFDELLDQIESIESAETVVFLDSGNLISDMRLGVPINTFAFAVQQELAERDSKTWVMLSHSVGEYSQVSYTGHHSLFGNSVSEGLLGNADSSSVGNSDAKVTLAELYSYVRGSVALRSGSTQTPILLQAGTTPSSLAAADLDFTLTELRTAPDKENADAGAETDSGISYAEPEAVVTANATTTSSEVTKPESPSASREEPSGTDSDAATSSVETPDDETAADPPPTNNNQ